MLTFDYVFVFEKRCNDKKEDVGFKRSENAKLKKKSVSTAKPLSHVWVNNGVKIILCA